MAEAINNGGPAFPVLEEDGRGNLALTSTGVTKRDFFAAMAMQGSLSNEATAHIVDMVEGLTQISEAAYRMADAMLKAREA